MTERTRSTSSEFDEVLPFQNEQGRNDRFTYAKVRKKDEWFFLKTARTPDLQQNLERECMWADFMGHVAVRHPEAHVRAPRMVGFEPDGSLLMEYIEAPRVAASNDLGGWKLQLDRYAHTLAVLDESAGEWHREWPDSSRLAGIEDVTRVWHRWLGEHYDKVANLPAAYELVQKQMPNTTMRTQHGDLTPWQMFANGKEWIIYDGEKAGDHLPRYNDLAYGYGRLFTRLQDREAASELLKKFLTYAPTNSAKFHEEFLPVMTFRAVGMLADAYHDSGHDYVDDALALLDICLSGRRDAFVST